MSGTAPVTVVETPEFLSAMRKLLTKAERAVLVDYLAHNPAVGELVPGTGGVRKLRWGLEGRGKRGRARDLLLSQRRHSAVRADGLREERAGGLEPAGPERFPKIDEALGRSFRKDEEMSKVADSIR